MALARTGPSQAYLTWVDTAGKKQFLRFDVNMGEDHSSDVEVTEHAVEKGANVVDHVRKSVDRFKLDVFVSNSPIHDEHLLHPPGELKRGALSGVPLKIKKYEAPFQPTPGAVFNAIGGAINQVANSLFGQEKQKIAANVYKFSSPFNAVSETYALLRDLQEKAQLVTVVTAMWDYANMIIEKVSMPRNRDSGDGAVITLEFREIRFAVARQATKIAKTLEKRAQKDQNKGAKGPNEASGPKTDVATQILSAVKEKGWWGAARNAAGL